MVGGCYCCQHACRVLQFPGGGVTTDADAQDFGGGLRGQAHGGVNMAGLMQMTGAGGPAGDHHALQIKGGNGALGVHAGKLNRCDARQTGTVAAQHAQIGALRLHLREEVRHQRALAGGAGVHVCLRQRGGDAESCGGGDVLRAGAQTALLSAACQQRRHCCAGSDVQCANAARSVQLVGGNRHAVAHDLHRDMPKALHRVHVQVDAPLSRYGVHCLNRLQHAGFVVCPLQADQPRVRAESGFDGFGGDIARFVRLDEGRIAAFCRRQDGAVLDGGDNRMGVAEGLHDLVVSLCAAGGENDVRAVAAQHIRQLRPAQPQDFSRGSRFRVGGRGIAGRQTHRLQHGGGGFLRDGRGGGMIEINAHGMPASLPVGDKGIIPHRRRRRNRRKTLDNPFHVDYH